MAHLYRDVGVKSLYTDRKFAGDRRDWQQALEKSTTLYIGNVSFYTTEEQLYALFGQVGELFVDLHNHEHVTFVTVDRSCLAARKGTAF